LKLFIESHTVISIYTNNFLKKIKSPGLPATPFDKEGLKQYIVKPSLSKGDVLQSKTGGFALFYNIFNKKIKRSKPRHFTISPAALLRNLYETNINILHQISILLKKLLCRILN